MILLANNSNCCARLSPVCAVWRSWPMPTHPLQCWKWPRFRQRRACLGSRSLPTKSGAPEDIAPVFEAFKGRAEALYVCQRPARNH